MALIHILDKQSDKIIGTLNLGEYTDDEKVTSSENENTFDFTALRKFDLLQKRSRLLLQDKDGFFSEYIIIYAEQNSRNQKFIKSNATFTDLQKAKIIEPQTLQGATADTATTKALEGTEWKKGKVDYNGIRTLKIEEYTNPYNLLKTIASEFGLDLRFRVAVEGNKIVRYVDLTLPDDEFDGKEVVFGKDLIGLRRIEDAQNIVTALLVLGPEQEDGTRLTVLVEDNDALQRWGRNGQHLIEVYEPQITAEEVTVERLRTLGENELKKRIDAAVTYECQAAIMEHIPGKEHEKIRLDRTLRIKDEGYTPPLYVEAKVLEIKEQPSTGKILDFKLGNYKEFSKADLEAQIAGLKKLLAQKASNAKLVETYELALQQAEEKAAQAEENAKGYTDTVKVEVINTASADATNKANQAENNAKSHADTVAGEAESNAKAYALSEADKARIAAIQAAATDAQTKVNAAKTALEADIALKADAQWVNGQLQLKADNTAVQDLQNEVTQKADVTWVNNQLVLKENAIHRGTTAPTDTTKLWLDTSVVPNVLKRYDSATSSWVKATPTSAREVGAYTKTEVDNALNSKVSVTTYTADKNGIISRLDSAESRITQNEQEIATKVSQTDYDALEGRVSQAESSIVQNANAIQSKVSQTDFNALKGRVSTAESTITQHANLIEQKVNRTDYDTDMNGVVTRLNSAESRITQTENEIATKVSNTTYQQDKTTINNNISQLTTRMGQAETELQQTSAQIALKANKTDVYTKTEVDGQFSTVNQQISQLDAELSVQADQIATKVSRTEFESLQIGGRNLLLNSYVTYTTRSADTNGWQIQTWAGVFVNNENLLKMLKPSTQYTIRYKFRLDSLAAGTTAYQQNNHGTLIIYSGVAGYNIVPLFPSSTDTVSEANNWVVGSVVERQVTFTTPAALADPNANYRILAYTRRSMNGGTFVTNETGTFFDIKIETGNVATDWTPALEDTQSQIDGLDSRVTTTETSITQLSNQIQLKANKTDVYTKTEADNKVTTAVNNAKSEIKLTTDSISQSVSSLQSTVNSQGTRLSSAESSITSLSTQIQSKVSQTTFESALSGKENTVYKQNTAPAHANGRLWLDTSKTPNVLYRSNGSAWIKATPTSAGEVGAFSQADGTALAGRLSTAESTITQQADLISQKVSKTDYNGNTIASLINQTATAIKLQAAKIALDGYVEAKHIKSLNGLNVGNGQFVVDENGNVKFAGNLEGASGTFGQVTVKDGDFYLKDSQSDIQYSLTRKRNLIKDHSFELVKVGEPASQDNYDHWWLPMTASTINWKKIGSPRVAPIDMNGPGVFSAIPIFGNRAILVNSTNYVEQAVWDIAPDTKYTFSVFAKRAYNSTVGAVQLEVHYIKTNVDGTISRATLAAQSFGNVNANYAPSRHSVTFTTPSQNVMNDYNIIFVIKSTNSNWVQCDGAQVVEGEYPTIYDMEESMWTFLNGHAGYQSNVIEYGWNGNGHYVRFGDGTQICWVPLHYVGTLQGASGADYRMTGIWTLPAAFIDTDYFATANVLSTNFVGWESITHVRVANTSTTSATVTVAKSNGSQNYAFSPGNRVSCNCFAIGRWKW